MALFDTLKKKTKEVTKKVATSIVAESKKKEAQKAAEFKAISSSLKSGAKTVYEAYKPTPTQTTGLSFDQAQKNLASQQTQQVAREKISDFGKTLKALGNTSEMQAATQKNKLTQLQNQYLGTNKPSTPLPYVQAMKSPEFRGAQSALQAPATISSISKQEQARNASKQKMEDAQSVVANMWKKGAFVESKLKGLQYTQSLTGSGKMIPLPQLKKENPGLVKQYSLEFDKSKRVADFVRRTDQVFVRDMKKFLGEDKYSQLESSEAWNPARVVPKMMSAAAFDVIDFEDLLQTGKNLKVRDGQLWLNGEPVGEEFTTEKGKKSAQKADIAAALLGSAPTYVGLSKGLAKLITKGAVSKVPSIQKFFGGVQQVQTKYPVLSEIALINPVEEVIEAGVRKGDRQEYTFSDFVAGLGIGAIMGGVVGIAGKQFKSEELEKVLDKAEKVAAKTGDINQVMAIPFGGTNLGTLYKENRFAFNKQVIPGQRPGIEVAAPLPKIPTIPEISPELKPLYEEAKKYKSADEFAEAQPVKVEKLEGSMDHRPSFEDMPPAYDLLKTDILPDDVYTHPDWSIANGAIRRGEKAANESWEALQRVKGNPDAEITLYRASPKNELRTGDWVSLSKTYAKAESMAEGVKVHEFKVKAKDVIFAGDDINEFGYWGHSTKDKLQFEKIWQESQSLPKTALKTDDLAFLRGHKKTPRAGIDAPAPLPKLEGKAEVMPWDEAAQSKPKTIDVGSSIEAEAKIRDTYKNAGQDAEYLEMTKADRALYEVYEELEMSQAGKRTRTAEGDFIGESSTFPDWIPAPYRSKELFNKVTQGLELDNLKYPPASAPKQRALYDLILGRIDSKLGVDTAAYRNFIQNNNEPKVKPSTASPSGRVGRSFKRSVGRKKVPSYPLTAKPIEGQKLLPAPSEPKLSVPKIKGIPAVSSLKYVTDEIKNAMPKANNPTVKAYDFSKLKELLQNPPSKKLPKGKGKILLPSDSSVLADTVKFKSKGGKVRITRDDFKGMQKLPELKVGKILENKFETKIRTFEKLGGWAKKNFYDKARVADHESTLEYKNIEDELKKLQKDLPSNSGKRIGIYATAQEPEGRKLLEKMGIEEIPELSSKEMEVFQTLRRKYDKFYDRINEARSYEGKEPIGKIKNYFTRILIDEPEEAAQRLIRGVGKNAPSVKFFKSREGLPSEVELDAFNVFKKYSQPVVKYVHMAPESSRMRELIRTNLTDPVKGDNGKVVNLAKDDRINTYNFLSSFVDDITGQKPPEQLKWLMDNLKKLNRNAAYAKLAWNIGSALIQPTAYRNTLVQLKFKNAMRGIVDLVTGKGEMALSKSRELLGRSFDASIVDALESKAGKLRRVAGDTGLKILQALDGLTARATWLGAYREAIDDMKLSEADAINFADDIVVKTQASAAQKDISPIQRTTIGKTMTLFQTFVINDLDFLKRDVLGIGNKQMTKKQAFEKILKYAVATGLVNYLYEDVAGVPSPMPRPAKALLAGNYKEAAKETLAILPVVGGSIKFGQLPLGTTGELFKTFVQDPLEGKFSVKKAGKALGSFAGVPGYNQLVKSYEGLMAVKNPGDTELLRKGENRTEKQGVLSTIDAIRAIAFGPYGTKRASQVQSTSSTQRKVEDLVKIKDIPTRKEAFKNLLKELPEAEQEKAADKFLELIKKEMAEDKDVPVSTLSPSQVKTRYDKDIKNAAAFIKSGDKEKGKAQIRTIMKDLTPEQQEAIADKLLKEIKS